MKTVSFRAGARCLGLRGMCLATFLVLGACSTANNGTGEGPGGAGADGRVTSRPVPGSSQDFAVNVGDRVFFEEDRSLLSQEARAVLDAQAVWLNRHTGRNVTIEGHADERGTRQYNLALGARRAEAVRDYLDARGVDPGRLQTLSFGKERPVAVCNNESCWSQNRRAVTGLDR